MKNLSDEQLLKEVSDRIKAYQMQVQNLSSELKIVNKKLEDAENMKSHFISNIANELLNPFSSIIGLTSSILSVNKEDWKKVISMVALIYSEAFQMDFQLKNIFAAAKLEAGEVQPDITNADIKSLIDSVAKSFRIEANKKKIKLISHIDDFAKEDEKYFKTDPEKIKIILANLISNAIKFSFHDAQIDITAKRLEEKMVLEVQDYGTGITDENQQIIYDRFNKGDSGINSINRGHGLGLSINKALIDILEGEINFDTELDKGTKFTISIPEFSSSYYGVSSDDNEFLFDDTEESF